MHILNPSPGDLLDRLSIVALKIACTTDAEQRRRFLEEQAAIVARVNVAPPVMELYARLSDINGLLWESNEIWARQAAQPDPPPSLLGLQVYHWNLERNRLIEAIDRELGTYTGPEKV